MAGRRPKAHLPFFSKYVDYYDDDKIMDLLAAYGPLGQTIYDAVVCEIFKNSYYLEIPLDKLAAKIIRIIGNRWVQNKQIVVQVIRYCADIGLFHKDLLSQNVITSVELQQCYAKVTVRRQFQGGDYWMLDENNDPLLSAPNKSISVYKNSNNVTENHNNADNETQKKSKENNTIYMSIIDYLNERCGTAYQNTAIETVQLILDKLSRGFTYEDFIKVINIKADEWMETEWQKYLKPSTLFGKKFEEYLNQKPAVIKEVKAKKPSNKVNNKFNQFPQREYTKDDYSTMEEKLLKRGNVTT